MGDLRHRIGQAKMRDRQRGNLDTGEARGLEEGAGAAAGIMQDGGDLPAGEGGCTSSGRSATGAMR